MWTTCKTIWIPKSSLEGMEAGYRVGTEILVNVLKEKDSVNVDDLCLIAKMPMSKVSSLLLTLEFSGIVRSLPGKMYRLN